MAVFPDNFGGNRQLAADPAQNTMYTILGDLTALNLRLSHVVSLIPLCDDAARNLINDIAAIQIVDASVLSHVREQATKDLRPLTRLPAVH